MQLNLDSDTWHKSLHDMQITYLNQPHMKGRCGFGLGNSNPRRAKIHPQIQLSILKLTVKHNRFYQVLKHFLWDNINYQQNYWMTYLLLAEFTYITIFFMFQLSKCHFITIMVIIWSLTCRIYWQIVTRQHMTLHGNYRKLRCFEVSTASRPRVLQDIYREIAQPNTCFSRWR